MLGIKLSPRQLGEQMGKSKNTLVKAWAALDDISKRGLF